MRKIGDYTITVPDADDASSTFVRARPPGRCRIRIYSDEGTFPVVLCTDRTTALADSRCTDLGPQLPRHVWSAFLCWASRMRWIEQRSSGVGAADTFAEVTFESSDHQRLTRHEASGATPLVKSAVEAIVGHTLD